MIKNNRKIIYSMLAFSAILAVILIVIIFFTRSDTLKVIFLDVGQGDAVLVEKGNIQILIDGGKDGKILLEKIGKHIPFWDRKIEMVVQTHPDQDHIGGLIDLFKAYDIETVMKTDVLSDSQTFAKLEDEIEKENSEIIKAESGEKINIADGAWLDVIFPLNSMAESHKKETNSSSVVMKLNFRESSFLFMGDLPSEQEKELLEEIRQRADDLKASVLKVSHHGSKYASSDAFLDAVKPGDAIVSVGANNAYGHPNSEVLQRLRSRGINIFRTDELNDIVYECQNSECKKVYN